MHLRIAVRLQHFPRLYRIRIGTIVTWEISLVRPRSFALNKNPQPACSHNSEVVVLPLSLPEKRDEDDLYRTKSIH